jgi:hypothetical protein
MYKIEVSLLSVICLASLALDEACAFHLKAYENFVQAATIVRMLADGLEDEEQRINFLASPLVKSVLGHGGQV